jgi:hypothetical protein
MVRPCVTTTSASSGDGLSREKRSFGERCPSSTDSQKVAARSYTSALLSPVGRRYQKRPTSDAVSRCSCMSSRAWKLPNSCSRTRGSTCT